jgi:hypothetical protein
VEKEISFRRGGVLKRLREPGFSYKTWEKELGEGGRTKREEMQGALKKTSGRSFFSGAPHCAPLRLLFVKASPVPLSKC